MARTPVTEVTPEALLAKLQQNVNNAKSATQTPPATVSPKSPAATSPPATAPRPNAPNAEFVRTPGSISNNITTFEGDETPASGARSQYTMTAQDVGSLQTAIEDADTYMRNPFGDFENVTYHWKFFMTQDLATAQAMNAEEGGDVSSMHVLNAIDGVAQQVIAETGVTTGFNIQDVRIEQIVGPNFQSRNTNTTKITMTLVEPLGSSLFEKIRNAAAVLGIKNYSKVFYYLDLTFKGYDPNGDQADPATALDVKSAAEVFPNGGRWLYQVQITNIDTKLDTSGSIYTLTCIPYNESAYSEEIMNLPETKRIDARTIGEFLDGLGESLTTFYDALYGPGYLDIDFKTHPIRHSRFQDEDPRDWPIGPQKGDENSARGLSFDGETTVQMMQGTSISDIIEFVFANTEKGQQIAKDVARVADQDESAAQSTIQRFRECVLFRIEPDVDITDYDVVYQNYMRKVSFHVWAYASQAPIISERQVEDAKKKEVQVQMVNELFKKGFLRKRYDHYFSGQNTEVLGLDVKYNLAWTAVLPMVMGHRATTESVSVHATYSDTLDKARSLAGTIEETTNRRRKLSTELIQLRDQQKEREASQTSTDATSKEFSTQVFAKKAELDALDASLQKLRTERDALRAAAQKEQQDQSPRATGVGFVEDLRDEPDEDDLPLKIAFRHGLTQSQTGTGTTPSVEIDRGFYGAMLEQLYGPVTTGLINVELEIRGDPYWIGYSNLERKTYMRSEAPEMHKNATFPNTQEGDCVFLLHFDYPFDIDPETGEPVIRENDDGKRLDTFNGLYRAIRVVHNFSGGQFTQNLTASRLPLVDIARVLGFQGAISSADAPLDSPSAATGKQGTKAPSSAAPSGSATPTVTPTLSSSVKDAASKRVAGIMDNPSKAAIANQIYSATRAEGYTHNQALGVVANGIAESSLNPKANIVDSNGFRSYGLFQLNGNGVGKGQSVSTMLTVSGNTNLILQEASLRGTQFKASTTPGQAAAAFMREVERPKDPTGSKATERSAIAESLTAYKFGN